MTELTDEELFNINAQPELEIIRMTPSAAIQQAIFDLCHDRADWKKRDDPSNVLEWLNARIANLEQAQRDLEELRKLKAALAVLKGAGL